MNKIVRASAIISLAFIPTSKLLAQGYTFDNTKLGQLVDGFANLLGQLIPIGVAVGLLYLIWCLIEVIRNPGDEEKRKCMTWGVLALFFMVAIWGIVKFVGNAVGIDNFNETISSPSLPTP